MSDRHNLFPRSAVLSAIVLLALCASAAAGPWRSHGDSYQPSQSISYDLGSKLVSGYFLQEDERCSLTMMVAERGDSDVPPQLSAARTRIVLDPRQQIVFDSEEGRSIRLTCGPSGAQMTAERTEPEARRYRRVAALKSEDVGRR